MSHSAPSPLRTLYVAILIFIVNPWWFLQLAAL